MGDGKARILAVERILLRRGSATMQQIMQDLSNLYNLSVERKALYDDLNILTLFLPIEVKRSKRTCIYTIEGGENQHERDNHRFI